MFEKQVTEKVQILEMKVVFCENVFESVTKASFLVFFSFEELKRKELFHLKKKTVRIKH